jgi:ATP-dependent DNA helicase RecG
LPKFSIETGNFRLYFYRAIPSENNVAALSLEFTPRQLIAINYVRKNGSITNAEYQELAGISKRTATRELKKLTDLQVLIQEGTRGMGTVYKLK